MVVIKVSFAGDLRRVSLQDDLSFHEVNETLKRLFNLPVSNCGLAILHVLEDGEKEIITHGKQYQAILAEIKESKTKILRLEIQANQDQPEPSDDSIDVSEQKTFLDSPDVRKELEAIILETVQSKLFLDTIVQKLAVYVDGKPSLENHVAPSDDRIEEVAVETVPQIMSLLQKSLLEPRDEMKNGELVDHKPEESFQEQIEPIQEPVQEIEQIQEPVPEPIQEPIQEPIREPILESILDEKKIEKQQEELKIEEEEFLVVEKPEGLSTSPLVKSFLNFFKAFKKDPPKEAPKKEIPESKLQEMIKQLNDMGFHDNEANARALRFHYDFNEGLDAVIEDLLTQGALGKPKELQQNEGQKEDDPIPILPPSEKQILVSEDNEEQLEDKKRKKSIEMPQKSPDSENDLYGVTEEDIQKLVLQANISREAAIKALRSQAW